jgi:hypothetical protein
MKNLAVFGLFLALSSVAAAEVSTRVCLADGNTPLEWADPNVPFVYRDIMVGTKLTIIVSSDMPEFWSGGLYIAGTDREYGVLSARDLNTITLDWEGSHFEAAGDGAAVYESYDSIVRGFDLLGDGNPYDRTTSSQAGDWFVIDYIATGVGNCKVGFYDYDGSGGSDYPVYDLMFSHVRTRDFNQDSRVDLADFALLASHWLETGCGQPEWCAGADIDKDGNVDYDDLTFLAEYWLQTTQ